MSQNWMTSPMGRRALYGYDAPTGGFFWTEFFREDELDEMKNDNDVVSQADGLVLSSLHTIMKNRFGWSVDIRIMLAQMLEDGAPTQFQVDIGKMFGKDIPASLKLVADDLMKNYIEYFKSE